MKITNIIIIVMVVLVSKIVAFAQYTPGTVSNGGSITGTISFEGTAPTLKALKIEKDKKVCAVHEKYKEEVVVGKSGGLKNVVVYIEDIKTGKAWEKKYTLDQKGCWFLPHVVIVGVGQKLSILNSDGILHNIHTFSKLNKSVNKAQPKFKKRISTKFSKAEFIKLRCDVHSWMSGWIVAAANPYYATTDETGNFTLTGVPAGTYTLKFWHETLGEHSTKVTVGAGGSAKADAKFSS